jgi:hypothetical protein
MIALSSSHISSSIIAFIRKRLERFSPSLNLLAESNLSASFDELHECEIAAAVRNKVKCDGELFLDLRGGG